MEALTVILEPNMTTPEESPNMIEASAFDYQQRLHQQTHIVARVVVVDEIAGVEVHDPLGAAGPGWTAYFSSGALEAAYPELVA